MTSKLTENWQKTGRKLIFVLDPCKHSVMSSAPKTREEIVKFEEEADFEALVEFVKQNPTAYLEAITPEGFDIAKGHEGF